jgi:hypothetical protein
VQHQHSTIYQPPGGGSLMGVKLIVEVMDHWQDAGLTKGERDDLIVLAENANDTTRETFKSVHADYILRRAGKKADSWRVALDALKRKKVLEHAVHDGRQMAGRPGQHAIYRIPVLCPDAPHDGLWGQCTRPKRVSQELTHAEVECVSPPLTHSTEMGYPADNPSNRLGYPTATEWVSREVTPTPPNPSGKNSLLNQPPPPAAAAPPDWFPASEEGVVVQEEGEGGESDPTRDAPARKVVDFVADEETMNRARLFVDKLPHDRQPSPLERAMLANDAARWLAEGWTHNALMAKCEAGLDGADSRFLVWRYRLQEEFVIKPPKPIPAQRDGLAVNGHQAYQNPDASTYRPPKSKH